MRIRILYAICKAYEAVIVARGIFEITYSEGRHTVFFRYAYNVSIGRQTCYIVY